MKNQNIAFRLKRKELSRISTEQERIRLLEELVGLNPKDSRDLELRTKFKKELVVLRKKSSQKKKQHSSNIYDSIKHDRQVVVVGGPNSGKSTLLHSLTGSNVAISEVPFTTYKPETGIFVYNDVSLQIVEVPSLYEGDNDRNKNKFIRNSDVVCVVARDEDELRYAGSILEDSLVIMSGGVSESRTHKYRPLDEIIEKPSFVAAWTEFDSEVCRVLNMNSLSNIGEEIYRLLGIMRVYCFKNGEIDGAPIVFPKNKVVTVKDFGKKLGMKKIRGAKIFGSSNAYDGQVVGLEYKLADGEKVSLR